MSPDGTQDLRKGSCIMEEYTIVTQGSSIYLERRLGPEEMLDEVDRGMLVSNRIGSLLPVSIQWLNADCRLLYNITGLTPVPQAARILENEERLDHFFVSLSRSERECSEYLLDPHKIDLTPEHIYLDATGRAYVVYVPTRMPPDRYDSNGLVGYVLRMVGPQMPQESRVISSLSRQLLYGEKISFADLEKRLQELQPQSGRPEPGHEQPQMPGNAPAQNPEFRGPDRGRQPEPTPESAPVYRPVSAPDPMDRPPQPEQDNPFAKKQADSLTDPGHTAPQPKKKDKAPDKEKKSGGLFGGLFGGKKNKKKQGGEEQENPFRQQAISPAPEQPRSENVPPPEQPRQSSSGYTVVSPAPKSAPVPTSVFGYGSHGEGGRLYLVQKTTNQYIHVTHTNFHIGRAEDIVDYTVHTQNCYLGNDHAYILIEDGRYYIVDNNTKNHTYLNERQLEPSQKVEFHAGDTIRMADIVFGVVAEG